MSFFISVAYAATPPSAAAEPAPKPLEYRFIYVPNDRPQDWPKRDIPYLPVEREEFEALVAAANAQPGLARAGAARITRATYSATFHEPDLLVGEARFELPHGGEKTALVTLDPFGFSLTAAQWADAGEATLGVQPNGKLAVLVERPGTLICKWSLRGRRDAAGTLAFPLELPPAAMAELELRLPNAVTPVLNEAVEIGRAKDDRPGHWRFQLSARPRAELRLVASNIRGRSRGLVLLQERSSYSLLPGGIDLQAQLKLDVHREPLRRLEMDLDPSLRVVSVQHAGAEVPWSVGRDTAQNEPRLSVEFNEPLLGPGRVITVTALAPLQIDAPVKLPRLRVRDVTWQEGEISLSPLAPLALDELVPHGCRQTKVSQLTGGPSGEGIDLQLFSADASVMVRLSRRPARGRITSGTTLRFASDSLRAEFRGRVEATEGEWFTLQATLAAGWEIDAVTADRPGALASWAVNRSARPAILVLQLAESVAANRPLEVMITGHRRAGADARFASQTLEMLHFRNWSDARRLLALETAASQNVRLDGPDRPRVAQRSSLSASDRALLPSAFSDAILEIVSDRNDWGATIERRTPRFSANVRSVVRVEKRDFTESYTFRCQPEGSRVDRLLASFSQIRASAPEFSGDESLGAITADRLPADERAARGISAEAEAWLVRWSQPTAEPFELRATRTLPIEDRVIPALAAVPDAAEQQGIVETRFTTCPLVVEAAERLEPVTPQAQAAEEPSRGGAAFRYDPLDELSGAASPALVLHAAADPSQPALCHVWRLCLHSLYRASGESDHLATFDMENRGAAECMLTLPPGAEIISVRVNDVLIARPPVGQELRLPLPDTEIFPVVVVEYSLRDQRMGSLVRCEAPWPAIDLPVALREWKVSFASQYQPLDWSGGPPDWPTRLFGPFARPVDDPPFHPLSSVDWRKAANHWPSEPGSLAQAKRLLESIGRQIASADASDVALGGLLTASQSDESGPITRLVVDERALNAIDVDSSALVKKYDAPGALDADSATALAAQRLGSLGLTLMLEGEQVVLTSRSMATRRGKEIHDAIFVSRPSAAYSPVRDSASQLHVYASLAHWLQSPAGAWLAEAPESGGHLHDVWASHAIEPDGGQTWQVYLIRRDVVVAAGWALGALVFCCGTWLARGRLVWLAAAGGLGMLAATWAPAALLPLAWALLLGSLLAAAWQRVRPRVRRSPASTESAVETRRASTWPAASSLLLLALLAGTAVGDDDAQAIQPSEPIEAHRVFVPVDSDNNPGTRYHVPTDFLDELRRRASRAGNEPRGWLITSAKYECQLSRQTLEAPISVTSCTARFKLEVLSSFARLRLPFVKRQVELAQAGARLDGQPIKMAWSETGDELQYDIVEPGLYELELSLLPVVNLAAEKSELKLSIPKVALATVDVSLPAEGLAVELPGIEGQRQVLEGGRKLSAGLGPIDTLVLRWPQPAAAAPIADVDELLWLNVRPGSVVLDVTLKLNVSGGALRTLRFAADRRLRLLPGAIAAKERPTPNEPASSDAPQTVELELQRPIAGHDTLRLSFFMTGASGVGSLRLPSFHTLNARVDSRLLAVTVDTGLEYETRDAQRLETLPATEFAAQWGGAEAALRDALAYRLSGDETAWSLATRSREPQTTVKESLALGFQRGHALVRYDAQLMTSAGYVFQHRLRVPPEVEIESIVLEEEGADRVSHWARNERGVVSVFLNRRLTGAQQLTLIGRLPVRASGRLALPKISVELGSDSATIEQAEVLSRVVRLYRQPTVRIALEDAAGLSPLPEPQPEQFDGRLGRLVIAQAARDDYSATVVVTANEGQVRDVEQLTLLRYANQQWQAEIHFRFTVDEGVLDFVRLGVPPVWSANIEVVSPAALTESSRQPGDNRQELLVRPLVPFSGECELKLRASVKLQPGENVSAPDIVAADLPAGERFWLLPRQVGIEAVDWDVERMSPGTLGQRWSDVPVKTSQVFRAHGERPRAVMSAVKAGTDLPRVRLSEVRLALCGGRMSGVAAFELSPGGRVSCPLELAAGWQVVEVSVGGSAVAPLHRDAGKWEVPLRSNRLPQRVEVAFTMTEIPTGNNLRWPIAWLGNWPVEETLLAICMPDDYDVRTGVARSSEEASRAVRLASAIELTELPAESVATTEQDELAAWYEPWAHWLVFCGRENPRTTAEVHPATDTGSDFVIDETYGKNARRLGVEEVLRRLARQPLRAVQILEICQQLQAALPVAHYHWTGPAGPSEIRFVRKWRGWLPRLSGSLWAIAFVVIALAVRRFPFGDFIDRWPHLVFVSAGLLWWLFCQPSAAGWLGIGCGLALALRSLWRPLA